LSRGKKTVSSFRFPVCGGEAFKNRGLAGNQKIHLPDKQSRSFASNLVPKPELGNQLKKGGFLFPVSGFRWGSLEKQGFSRKSEDSPA